MKNNGGWGLRAELIICLILTIFFGIAVVLIGSVVNRLNDINNNDNNNVITNDNNVIIQENNKENDSKLEIEEKQEENTSIDKNINFNSLEDKLVRAGVMYANKYYKDDKLTVTVVRLQTEEILKDLSINDTKCTGYVEIEKDESFKYYPYIKCGDLYQTQGYDETKDNLDN